MYEHLPATATREEVLAALDNKSADGVILEYPLNELPEWVFEVGHPEMDPVPVSRVKPVSYTHLDVYKRQLTVKLLSGRLESC